jgi:hypothetical protein
MPVTKMFIAVGLPSPGESLGKWGYLHADSLKDSQFAGI